MLNNFDLLKYMAIFGAKYKHFMIMTDEEYEELWKRINARNERARAEWEALPEETKERYRKEAEQCRFWEDLTDAPPGVY